jgi:hypothetical protein
MMKNPASAGFFICVVGMFAANRSAISQNQPKGNHCTRK